MPRSATPARARIIEAAYALFYAQGFNRTGMEEIAAAADLTKRTLYQHFDSKDAVVAAVLEHDAALSMPRVGRWIDAVEADPEAGVAAVFSTLAAWAATPGWAGPGFTRIVMELADLPGHPVHRIARTHKQAILTRLAQAAGSAALALELMIVLEGTLILFLVQRDPAVIEAGRQAASRILGAHRR